jgi:hypothetical protein
MRAGLLDEASMAPHSQMVILGEYGHGIGGPGISEAELADYVQRVEEGGGAAEQWFDLQAARRHPQMRAELGPVGARSLGHPNIFPNLWVALTYQLCLRIPKGPLETELWWFTLLPKNMGGKERRMAIYMANHVFGPAGLLEQDDGENWSHSTRGARGAYMRTQPLNYSMGMGLDAVETDASGQYSINTVVNEHGQRWTYQAWQEWMLSSSWEDLKVNHSTPPQGRV